MFLATLIFMNPTSTSAHHGTDKEYVDSIKYECRNGDQYEIKKSHYHVDGVRYDFITTKRTLVGICII